MSEVSGGMSHFVLPVPALHSIVVPSPGESNLGRETGAQFTVFFCNPPTNVQRKSHVSHTIVYSGMILLGMRKWRRLSTCFLKRNHLELTWARICEANGTICNLYLSFLLKMQQKRGRFRTHKTNYWTTVQLKINNNESIWAAVN